jgi:hypothetical protein
VLPLAALLAAAGCNAQPRSGVSNGKLEASRAAYNERVSHEVSESAVKLVRHLKREYDDYASGKSTTPPVCDILILSGGADYGAFGAGVLQGWGKVQDPAHARPEFDVVAGVSTGALIAPFAFIGDEQAYERAFRLYQEPRENWLRMRGLLFFLPTNVSLMDVSELRTDIEKEMSPDVVAQVVQQSHEGRLLRISATNLDYGQRRIWDLGAVAERTMADPKHDLTPLHKILLASSAIPGAFPPVEIEGNLYVDGATTANILYEDRMQSPETRISTWRRMYPDLPVPKMRYWVIINNQLESPPDATQLTWVNVVERSLATSIRASTATSVQHLATQLALMKLYSGVDTEFHVISIPNTWRQPKPGIFVKENMVSLAKLGYEMGRNPSSWKEEALLEEPPLLRPRPAAATSPATAAAPAATAPATPTPAATTQPAQ